MWHIISIQFSAHFLYFVLIHLCVKERKKNYGKPPDCMAISVIADLMIHFSQCTQKDAFAITIVDYKVVKLDGNRPKWKIIKRNNRIIEHIVLKSVGRSVKVCISTMNIYFNEFNRFTFFAAQNYSTTNKHIDEWEKNNGGETRRKTLQ